MVVYMQRKSFSEAGLHHHFVTRQDCRNACRKIRDFVNHHHKNDALSVDRIVSELKLEEHCPVIAYKPCEMKDEKYPMLREENFLSSHDRFTGRYVFTVFIHGLR